MKITKIHVNKRILTTDPITGTARNEYKVLELSPSGKRVKLRNLEAKTTFWDDVDDHEVLEVLP